MSRVSPQAVNWYSWVVTPSSLPAGAPVAISSTREP